MEWVSDVWLAASTSLSFVLFGCIVNGVVEATTLFFGVVFFSKLLQLTPVHIDKYTERDLLMQLTNVYINGTMKE